MNTPPLSLGAKGLVALFTVSGTTHLVRPETFLALMPKRMPAKREIIYGSGVAELACAAGMLHARTRSLAGWASFALLLGVYPGNLKMAADSARTSSTRFQLVSFGRLPLQLPMLRAAWRVARGR